MRYLVYLLIFWNLAAGAVPNDPPLRKVLAKWGYHDCSAHAELGWYYAGYGGAETDDDGVQWAHVICQGQRVDLSISTSYYTYPEGRSYVSHGTYPYGDWQGPWEAVRF